MSLILASDGRYRSPLLSQWPWLEHAFGTAVAPPEPGYLFLKQIHSTCLHPAGPACDGTLEGDGLYTDQPGLRIAVKTADCVPLLLADPRQRVVAAVHAGWRGTVGGIAAVAVRQLETRFGSRAEDLHVACGPSIGLCCFEVGREVASQFETLFPDRDSLRQLGPDEKTHIDLRAANLRVLRAAGVPDAQIECDAPCTCCGGQRFYSWRRDHEQGQRMYSVIGLRQAPRASNAC